MSVWHFWWLGRFKRLSLSNSDTFAISLRQLACCFKIYLKLSILTLISFAMMSPNEMYLGIEESLSLSKIGKVLCVFGNPHNIIEYGQVFLVDKTFCISLSNSFCKSSKLFLLWFWFEVSFFLLWFIMSICKLCQNFWKVCPVADFYFPNMSFVIDPLDE